MFIPDMPNVPPQNVPVMIAQANQAQAGDMTKIRTLGVCHPAPNHAYSLDNVIEPIGEASFYLQEYEHQTVAGPATATVLHRPKNGILRLLTEADRGMLFSSSSGPLDPADPGYVYLPKDGYVGKDSATIQVVFGGIKVNVKYYFQAVNGNLGSNWDTDYCSKKGVYWKISSTIDPNGSSTVTSVEYQTPTTSEVTSIPSTGSIAVALRY